MVQQGHAQNVYLLRCLRCGGALELPHDPRLLHIDCPFCGQDNVLPHHLIEARQRQHALEVEHQARAKYAADQAAAKAKASKLKLMLYLGGAGFAMLMLGTCVAIGVQVENEEEAAKKRAADPNVNGHAAILALMEKMKKEKGCDRILVQPSTHHKEAGTVSLDMIKDDACVHILGTSGTGAPISIKYTTQVALTKPIPAASPLVDYRLCASQTATHTFSLESHEEPFTVAALECPRAPEEGGSRSKPDDPLTTGKARVSDSVKELAQAGCSTVIAEPSVSRGTQSFTLTSPANGPCFNLLLGSYFPDVTFSVSLTNPNGNAMPVPPPASKMRVLYCPTKAGQYKVTITPSTSDHYSHASVDCPRNGREGLRREQELKKQVHGLAAR
jgi:hypothetical protein